MSPPNLARVRIGADVGGTFTDVVLVDSSGVIWTHKVPSTPPHFERAVLEAVAVLLRQSGVAASDVDEVAHGTTVATNCVLEHRGARTALITTRGFRDVLELRRTRAPQIYNLFFDKPPQLVERGLRFEIDERIAADGTVLMPLTSGALRDVGERLQREQVESVAVCLLHSYSHPQHEREIGAYLHEVLPDTPVSLSCEVLPERKEYERTATTVVNAYVRPVMEGYLQALGDGLRAVGSNSPLLIMQSAGGLTPEADAALRPVFALESGPAAGVLAAGASAEAQGIENVITLDMGGTTAKASIIEGGRIGYSPEYEVGSSLSAGSTLMGGSGELIRAPSIDIAEVGAGGGSIAFLDSAGGLRVGPRSAGAIPGPVCYGRGGTEPTLTDANVALGFIHPGELADGEVRIDPEAAAAVIGERIAKPLGLSLLAAAEGIHRIANARTMRALRSVSTERGRDPRDFILMAFGGSGPIHAAGLARELAIGKVIVPPNPGLFSAVGLLCSGVEHHEIRSCLLSGDLLTAAAIAQLHEELEGVLQERFAKEGFSASEVSTEASVDIRFKGQTSDIRVELPSGAIDEAALGHMARRFADEHERLYGHRSDPDNPLEVTAARAIGRVEAPTLLGRGSGSRSESGSASRTAYFGDDFGSLAVPVLARSALTDWTSGPLLIDEYDSTIVVPPATRALADDHGNVVIEIDTT